MERKLLKVAKKVIEEKCKNVDLNKRKPLVISIYDSDISFSDTIDSIKDADECILYLPTVRGNTVPDRYHPSEFVTFLNPSNCLIYIDSECNVHNDYKKGDFSISTVTYTFGANRYFVLKMGLNKIFESNVSEDEFQKLWDYLKIASQCVQYKEEEFTTQLQELEKKINEQEKEIAELKKSVK